MSNTTIKIADVEFVVSLLEDARAPGWALLAAADLTPSVTAAYGDDNFLNFVGRLGRAAHLATLSRWDLLTPEFGWPYKAQSCTCLSNPELYAVAQALGADGIMRTPGLAFDHCLVRVELLAEMGATGESGSVTADDWLAVIGLERSFAALGFVTAGSRRPALREALLQTADAWRRDGLVRAFDAYVHGGDALTAADALRDAYINYQLAESGYTFSRPTGPGAVFRRLYLQNSLRMSESVCCTTRTTVGSKVFATDIERLAQIPPSRPEE